MIWRVIFTDSESETGVAPVCEQQTNQGGPHCCPCIPSARPVLDSSGVYDCCPHPHIETYSEDGAKRLAKLLTELDAGPCL